MFSRSDHGFLDRIDLGNEGLKSLIVRTLAALFLSAFLAWGSSSPASADPKSETGNWNVPVKTLGGTQLWSDSYLHAGWRIQRNVITGHSRLLDPANTRRAWGSYNDCKRLFDDLKRRNRITPASRHLVLLVHGIAPKPGTFTAMDRALDAAGYDAAAISYPSTRDAIEAHAAGLEALLNQVEGTTKVSFVTHSMGGLVVRQLLHRNGAWKDRLEMGRIVQIAPPHLGSEIAEWAADLKPYKWILGNAGQQLTPGNAARIPLLKHSFAIIAGGKKDGEGFNPLLPGDDDGVVRVAETKLPGTQQFLLVKATHTALVSNPETIQATINFLKRGTLAN